MNKSKDRVDNFTGKHFPSEYEYNERLDEVCDKCGTNLITRCLVCGAPVCCPKCCAEDNL